MKWWAASLSLVVLGALGLLLVPRGPSVGPTLAKPVGKVSLSPSESVTSTTFSLHPTRTVNPAGAPPVGQPSFPPIGAPTTPVSRSTPIHISIPQIGVSSALSELGLNPDRTVQVPTSPAEAGWYKYDVTPGEKGSAVILGHVDNRYGPAVFFYIDRLNVGSRVYVTLESGKILEFSVIGVRMYSKSNFPDQLVYGPRNYPALQLVTCGGYFDHATGHYLSNIVVFTALVKT